MKLKKQGFLLFILIFLTGLQSLSSQTRHNDRKDFPKRRDNYAPGFDIAEMPFSLIAIKTEYNEVEGVMFIDLKFNRTVFAPSIVPGSIQIDGKIIPPGTIRFSKSGRGIKIAYKGNPEMFSLKVQNIISSFGELIIPEDIIELEKDNIYIVRNGRKPKIDFEPKEQENE